MLDYTCLDGDCARFQLPDPSAIDDGFLDYSVYIRAVTSKGSATLNSCFTDSSGTWCYAGEFVMLNSTDPQTFQDVSAAMLQVCDDQDDDPSTADGMRVPLFSDDGADYWWRYTNDGLKLAQVRFYPAELGPTEGGACTAVIADPASPSCFSD